MALIIHYSTWICMYINAEAHKHMPHSIGTRCYPTDITASIYITDLYIHVSDIRIVHTVHTYVPIHHSSWTQPFTSFSMYMHLYTYNCMTLCMCVDKTHYNSRALSPFMAVLGWKDVHARRLSWIRTDRELCMRLPFQYTVVSAYSPQGSLQIF